MSAFLETERLTVRPWKASDANRAMAIYGAPSVSPWLVPALSALDTPAAMRSTLLRWRDDDEKGSGSAGHWAIQRRVDAELVGGLSLQYEPPGGESLTIAWVLAPSSWGNGYAAEACDALIRWAMHEQGATEVFAILQPDNARAAATAARIGMEWVTDLGHLQQGRYQVYRIRHGDLAYRE